MSTAEIKASDEPRKAEEEEEQQRKAEEEEQLRAKRAAADGKDSVPEDGNPVSEDDNPVPEDQQSAPTYSRSHLQVDEKDWCDKREAKGKEVPEPEHPITPRSPEDYDLFDGDEKAREEFCKYAAKQMFDGKMGW